MREVNLSGLDLNLLPPLAALLRQRNVTHAAKEAGLSQPAMSRALARLRAIFNDELLVRTKGGYVLTPRGQELAQKLRVTLGEVRALFETVPFEPMREQRTLRIAASDVHCVTLLPKLIRRLQAEAPRVQMVVEAYGADVEKRMADGTLDLAFALTHTPLPPGAMSEFLCNDALALVMRRGHPAAGMDWTLADYGRFEHVGVALVGDGRSNIDAELAAHSVTRRMALIVPNFLGALAAVAATDLVTTISANFARQFASTFDLVLKIPPLQTIDLPNVLVWSHIKANDAFLGWVRRVFRESVA